MSGMIGQRIFYSAGSVEGIRIGAQLKREGEFEFT